jgi:hypothetical protein
MLLVIRYELIKPFASRLAAEGYGYACLNEPKHPGTIDDQTFIEMLQDWSWSGESKPPQWLTGQAE